jgi:hypothetical protein
MAWRGKDEGGGDVAGEAGGGVARPVFDVSVARGR